MAERSILAAVSGIDSNQTYLDSIANNIANANTVGYKETSVQFDDLLSEQLSGSSAPTAAAGGINPVAVGSGVRVGSNQTNQQEGSLEQTGQASDVAIQGNGYLVVNNGGTSGYTRNGSLTVDANGNLTTQSGGLVQGWQASSAGTINTTAPLGALKLPTGETIPAAATTAMTVGGNLPAWNGVGTPPTATSTMTAYDALGDQVPVTLTFTGVAATANTWTMQGTVTEPNGSSVNLFTTPPTVTFNATTGGVTTVTGSTTNTDGSLSVPVSTMPANYNFPPLDTWKFTFPAPGTAASLTQFANEETMSIESQDGHASGTLQSYSIGSDGIIRGSFSSGTTLNLGQIALASFANPSGLADNGGGLYSATANSGQANVGAASSGARGSLLGGELEQSNVNLGSELTNLIGAQEAYQANTKVLTSTQQVIQALESVA